MNYYYNENTTILAVTTNFEYEPIPAGFKKISKEKYEELQEELNKASEETEDSE